MSAPPGLPPADELLKKSEEYLQELEKGPWPSHVAEMRKTGYPLHVYGVGLVARKSPWGPSVVKTKRLTGVLARIARDWVPGGGGRGPLQSLPYSGQILAHRLPPEDYTD
jgi:hypothetical protein